jgi:hypothetical protein
MATIQPQGDSLRKAVKWISDGLIHEKEPSAQKLIETACLKFNLSPSDAEYLSTVYREK